MPPQDFFTPPTAIPLADQAAARQQQEQQNRGASYLYPSGETPEPGLLRHTRREHTMRIRHDDHFSRMSAMPQPESGDAMLNFNDVWSSFDTPKRRGKRGRH